MNSEHDRKGRNRPRDFALDEPIPTGATEPVDVVQVRADEALIAALSRSDPTQIDDPIDERLAGLLRSWRDDVHAEPERPLVDLTTAQAALATAPRPRRRHNPIGPWATAAAVLVIAFVGMGLAARGAEPGDPLWNVTKVLYSEKAKSVEAAATVRTKLDEATQALHSGKITEAEDALNEAQRRLSAIALEDGQQDLANRTQELLAELDDTATVPTAPTQTSGVTPPSTTAQESSSVAEPPPPAESPTATVPTEPSTGPTETTGVGTPEPTTDPPGAGSGSGTGGTGEAPGGGGDEGGTSLPGSGSGTTG